MKNLKFKDILRYEIMAMIAAIVVFTMIDFIPNSKKVYQNIVKSKLETKAATLKLKRESSGKKKVYEQNVAILKEGLKVLKGELLTLERKVIKQKNLPLVVLEFEEIAGELPVELISMKPMEEEILGNYELQPVEIRFKGTYKAATKFIENLEELNSVMAVYDVTMNKDLVIYPKLDIHLTALIIFKHQAASERI